MPKRSNFRAVACAGLAAVVGAAMSACHHVAAPVTPPALDGRASINFVEPPPVGGAPNVGGGEGEMQPADVLLIASPIQPLAKPVYPEAALGAHAAPVMIGVRIVVDEMGRVAEIGASPLTLSTPSVFHREFHAAIEMAVAQWRFRPAIIRHLVPVRGGNGTSHWTVARADPTPYTFDVSFVFSTTGDVTTALRK